jgi:hypothetical protein
MKSEEKITMPIVRVKSVAVIAILVLIFTMVLSQFAACNIIGSQTSPTTTTQTTTLTATNISWFQENINYLRNEGKSDIADKLVTLYATEPDVAYSFSGIEINNPDIAELVMQQPWYLDGLSDAEKIFITDGLGDGGAGGYGIGAWSNINNILEKIVVNQQYAIGTVQLKEGVKNVVVMYDRDDDSVSKENVDLTLKIVEASASGIEQLEGAKYPLDGIDVFVQNDADETQSYTVDGTISMNFSSRAINLYGVDTLLEEMGHLMMLSRENGVVRSESWIEEGIAQFSSAYLAQKLTQNPPSWWENGWNESVQGDHDSRLSLMKEDGVWGTPLVSLDSPNAPQTHIEIGTMGFLFMKDLYDAMGQDAYTEMLSGVYDFQSTHSGATTPTSGAANFVTESIFEQYALSSCPNDTVKSEVQNLFNTRVFGTAQ